MPCEFIYGTTCSRRYLITFKYRIDYSHGGEKVRGIYWDRYGWPSGQLTIYSHYSREPREN